MVWYGAGIRKLGDGDLMITGGGTEMKVSIPSHAIPIPFRWEYHPNIFTRKALKLITMQGHQNTTITKDIIFS